MEWRNRLAEVGIPEPLLVHLTAYISPTVRMAAGTMVLLRALVNTNCQVERGCIIKCGAIVDHDCVL